MFAARGFLKAAFLSFTVTSLGLFAASSLRAQQPAQPDLGQQEIENSKYQFSGVINANAVFVRSGPSENDYATLKLDKGAEVTVVGIRFEWLKIIPPEGSFCYVAKAYVNRAGNGSIGQVSTTLNVRVGSALNPLKTKVAAKLEPGERVEILGEQDEYFKIKPPKDVYLYINKQFVDPVRPVKASNDAAPAESSHDATAQTSDGQSTPAPTPDAAATPQTGGAAPVASNDTPPTSQPSNAQTAQNDSAAPTSQPSVSADAEFDKLEQEYAEISQKPLDEQPIDELLSGYQKLSASSTLPESMRRICDWKVSVLKTRAQAKDAYLGVKKMQDDMKSKQMALRAEQGELEQRVKDNQVEFYTAVGTLRTSSLQQGPVTLYRLTDPANGSTVVYLRSDDPKLGQYIGTFIGVKGEVSTDAQLNLRTVTTKSIEPVNPAKVGQSIAAQIVPPSLLPGGGTANASTGTE